MSDSAPRVQSLMEAYLLPRRRHDPPVRPPVRKLLVEVDLALGHRHHSTKNQETKHDKKARIGNISMGLWGALATKPFSVAAWGSKIVEV